MVCKGFGFAYLASVLFCFGLFGQEKSIVTIRSDVGMGRGVLISTDDGTGWGLVATAAHVVEPRQDGFVREFEIEFSDGQKVKTSSYKEYNWGVDKAILRCKVPNGILATPSAFGAVAEGDKVRVYLNESCPEVEVGAVVGGNFFCPIKCRQGDSGSPICNSDGHIVGVVSGGWVWLERPEKTKPLWTWPLRAARVN